MNPSKTSPRLFRERIQFRTRLTAFLLVGALTGGVVHGRPVDDARAQALAKRGQALADATATRANYNLRAPGMRADIATQNARGSAAWTDLMTKDTAAPDYHRAHDLLNEAAMELSEAEMLLESISDILDTGDRYIGHGDAKGLQGDAMMARGEFRVAIYAYWEAKDWYRQAIAIFGRVADRLNEVDRLINSARGKLTTAEGIIAGLPAPAPMPMPGPGLPMPGPGVGPMPAPAGMPLPGSGSMPMPGMMP